MQERRYGQTLEFGRHLLLPALHKWTQTLFTAETTMLNTTIQNKTSVTACFSVNAKFDNVTKEIPLETLTVALWWEVQ